MLAGIIISDQVIALRSTEPFTVAKKSQEFISLSTVYFSLSLATSLTTTLLIAWKLFSGNEKSTSRTAQFDQQKYRNPWIEIPIESAVLYSTTLLIFLVLDVRKNKNIYYAQNIHAQVTVRNLPTHPTPQMIPDIPGFSRVCRNS